MNRYGLIFFDKFPDAYLRNEKLLSALQSLESALILLGHGRYPNAVALMTECIEKMLKSRSESKFEDRVSLEQLIKDYNRTEGVNPELAKKSHEVRQFRNKIIHGSYSPKDDESCIKLAFTSAMPYIDHLVRTITDDELSGIFASMGSVSNDWLGRVFLDTRRVIHRKVDRKENKQKALSHDDSDKLKTSLTFLNMVFIRISMTGYNLKAITPAYNSLEVDFCLAYEEDDRGGSFWEFKKERFSNFFSEEFDDAAILLDDFHCVRCNEERIVALEEDARIVKIGCAGCEYIVTDSDVIAVFFTEKINDKIRAKLFSDSYSLLAQDEII